jgi:hypothetical protein
MVCIGFSVALEGLLIPRKCRIYPLGHDPGVKRQLNNVVLITGLAGTLELKDDCASRCQPLHHVVDVYILGNWQPRSKGIYLLAEKSYWQKLDRPPML